MSFDMKVFLTRFVVETKRHCAQMEKELLALEADGVSEDGLASVFRIAHTIKGAARMLKQSEISDKAHQIEDVLEELRGKRRVFDRAVIDELLQGIDLLRSLLDEPGDSSVQKEKLASGGNEKVSVVKDERIEVVEAEKKADDAKDVEFVQIRADRLDELIRLMGEMVSFQYRKMQQVETARKILQEADVEKLTIKRDLQQLHAVLRNDAATERQLTGELQECALQLRMLPIGSVFDEKNRLVRDFARANGKEVEFKATGGATELDRKITEQLGDCLTHLIRNAIDHGIEAPLERSKLGKKLCGQIRLTASYDGSGVTVILQDDGAGIDLEKVRKTALQKALLTKAEAEKMTEGELLELIFLPGFSTSPIITDLSGRGVGMNFVRKTVTDKLKGSVRVQSMKGEGTTFFLKVPITLALSRLLLVQAGTGVFAVPVYSVQEVLLVSAQDVIEVVGKQALRLREQIVPLENLAAVLDCPQNSPQKNEELLVAILTIGAERLGLIVDAVISEADMVVKSLPGSMKSSSLLAGFTIGGNDEIISVLNATALSRRIRELKPGGIALSPLETKRGKRILVVDDSANTREIVKSILESYGYKVELAEDGLAALEKTGATLYDAVITDVEMPQLDGFNLTLALRRDERYRQIPVIIVTSREKAEDKRRGIEVGANAYIVKGAFDQNNLVETLQNLIG